MEKLSSREAIAELMAWLDHVEQQQEREEPINSQGSAAQVKTLLQKYKVNGKLRVQACCEKDGSSLQALSYPSPCSQEDKSETCCMLLYTTLCFHDTQTTACSAIQLLPAGL